MNNPIATSPRMRVYVNQVWEITAGYAGGRIRIRVDAFEGLFALATVVSSGRQMRVQVRTLERQYRGAQLIADADGDAPVAIAPIHVTRKPSERTASDYRRTTAPRGVPRGGKLTLVQVEIEKLLAEDRHTLAEIGRRLGISGNSVAKHRNAIYDVRALDMMEKIG